VPLPRILATSLRPLTAAHRRAAAHPGGAASNQLNLTMQPQQQTNWCWSAVSVSVKLFYTSTYAITQCEQANRQLSQTSCCVNGASSACNVPWYLDRALSGLGNLASPPTAASTFAVVTAQITAGHPLGCRIGWFTGGGHFMVIDGCDPASPSQLVTIKDPIYGTSVLPYNTFATSYQGAGSWTTSYQTQP